MTLKTVAGLLRPDGQLLLPAENALTGVPAVLLLC
jgi:hypothetical protein